MPPPPPEPIPVPAPVASPPADDAAPTSGMTSESAQPQPQSAAEPQSQSQPTAQATAQSQSEPLAAGSLTTLTTDTPTADATGTGTTGTAAASLAATAAAAGAAPGGAPHSPAPGASTLVPELGGDEMLARAARGTAPLANQVAGHAGVMSDESGSLVIKPALPREIAFYQLVQSAPRSAPIAGLKPYLPKFYGTLALTGRVDEGGQIRLGDVPGAAGLPESIVLENLTYLFTHPCVLDAKLGTKLHGPDATPEKAARMMKKAAETTTGTAGLRLTGASTWHALTESFIATPRGFGYDLKVEGLPEGMRRFFPLPDDKLPLLSDVGQTGPDYVDHALPPRLTARVLTQLDEEIGKLTEVLSRIELRAVGASLLVVYEGDAERLAQAFERFDRRRVTLAAKSLARSHAQPHQQGVGNGYDDESTDESDDDELSESESSSDLDDDDDDGIKADEKRARRCPPLVVRLIDFAHTWLEEGEGPDEGVLLGLRTLRGLVQGRLKLVEEWIAANEPKAA